MSEAAIAEPVTAPILTIPPKAKAPRGPKRDCGLGTLFTREGIWWLSYTAGGQRIRESTKTRDRSIAEAMLDQKLREATPVPASLYRRTVTVADLLELARREFEVGRPREHNTFVYRMKLVQARFGSVTAEELQTEAVGDFQSELFAKGYSGWHIADALRILKKGYMIGRRAGIVKRWPLIQINWDRSLKSHRIRRERKSPPVRAKVEKAPRAIPPMPAEVLCVRQLKDLHIRDAMINERRVDCLDVHWKHPLLFFGDRDPRSIKNWEIESYKGKRLGEGVSRQTVNHELIQLRRGFNLARILGFLKEMPVFQAFKVNNARQGFLVREDYARLVATLQVLDRDVAAAVRVLYNLGWRKREVFDLTWAEVDVDSGLLTLPAHRTKTRTARRIKLPAILLEVFREQHKARKGPFVFHRDGSQIKDMYGVWKRAVASIGRPGLLIHDMRRSMARNALQAGVPQATIMMLGGWKTNAMFLRYAIVDEGMLADALEKVTAYTEAKA